MEIESQVKIYDVIISGAGPAGCACALALKDANLKVALLDKSFFPRDKVCGDAIPSRAIKTLKSISPEFSQAFKNFHQKCLTTKSKMYYGSKVVDFNWVGEAYSCTRIDFDNFLFSLVSKQTTTEIFENTSLDNVTINDGAVYAKANAGKIVFKASIIIGADGAHSIVAKQLAGRTLDRNNYVGAVRAYYSNIAENKEEVTEVFLNKKWFPSYFWVFPLPENKANVGFGMLSSEVAKRKLNLKKTFQDFIDETPELAERFSNATKLGDIQGYGLPLGSKRVKISGDHFILVGDAASLIDPTSGQGIGNAMFSGKLAAEQVVRCFKANNFSEHFMKAYDKSLFKEIGTELKVKTFALRIVPKLPFLIDWYYWLANNDKLRRLLQKKLIKN